MACGSCQKNKEQNISRPRVVTSPQTQQTQQTQPTQPSQPLASPKFQSPKVLPPLK